MPGIPFITLKVISGYKRKTQNENNYSETKKTLFLLPHGTADCRETVDCGEKEPQRAFHLVPGEGPTTGDYLKF
jgi:hypothetical protein